MYRYCVFFLAVILLTSGCVVKNIGNTVRYNIQGEFYMDLEDFEGGKRTFEKILKTDPYNARARFFYGRFLLLEGKAEQALAHFQKAVAVAPNMSKYQFWLGVAYGENKLFQKERASYLHTLQLEPQFYLALVYLGHNYLKFKEYEKALALYQKALDIWPYNPQALYNRGIILRKLGRKAGERLAWLFYLDSYPTGRFARVAAERLNNLEDFSYRNYKLGSRTITLTEIGFVAFKDQLLDYAKASLNVVGATVVNMKKGVLNIVVYQTNNRELAKMRSLAIRRYLYERFPELEGSQRVQVSWFDTPESRVVQKKEVTLDESVQFFLSDLKV